MTCARFFAGVAKLTGDAAWRNRAQHILAAIATPRTFDDQGRMVGEYLLALDDSGVYSW